MLTFADGLITESAGTKSLSQRGTGERCRGSSEEETGAILVFDLQISIVGRGAKSLLFIFTGQIKSCAAI